MTTALVPTTTQTAREYLASLTPPLAKSGPGVRGRFSQAAHEALVAARAAGVVFADDVKVVKVSTPKPAPAAAAPVSLVKAPAPAAAAPTVPAGTTVNAKEARAWAKANGIAVGERGRLHPDVIAGYLAATGGKAAVKQVSTVTAKAPTPLDMPLRKQKVAYGRIQRKEGDGAHITEPILAITDCHKCKKGVQYCACKTGPRLPAWAGGTACSFDRPTV